MKTNLQIHLKPLIVNDCGKITVFHEKYYFLPCCKNIPAKKDSEGYSVPVRKYFNYLLLNTNVTNHEIRDTTAPVFIYPLFL
jgi:hypothetical protein